MRIIKGTAMALALGLGLVAMQPQKTIAAEELTTVVFSLDFIPLGRHAPWYAALEEGFFKEEGLDVKIIPAQGTAQVMQAVASGSAHFGFVDLPGVVIAQAGGTDIKMLTVNYQKAPYTIFSLANGANVQEPKQLEGLSLGSGAGSITPKVIAGYMSQRGLDATSLKLVNVAPPARASALMSGQVGAIEFFLMSKPGLEASAKEAGTELKSFLLADHGLELYSNGIGAMANYVENNPDIAKRFVRAALKGWKFTIDNPDKAADDIVKNVDGLKKDVVLNEIEVVKSLAVTEDVKAHGLGSFSEEKMKAGVDFVVQNLDVKGKPPEASAIYLNGFLPQEPILP